MLSFSTEQIRHYFEHRLDRSIPSNSKVAVKCPFHDDATASATVFLDGNGGFNCHGCGAKGSLVDFEMRYSKSTREDAVKAISEITGAKDLVDARKGTLTACYDFRGADGRLAYQKRRYESQDASGKHHKTFQVYHEDATGRMAYGIGDAEHVLYHLPDVVTANMILCAEGEKDCDNLQALAPKLWPTRPGVRICTTCNFDGAWQPGQSPKWRTAYNAYFAGKAVVVFEDNDEAGRTWADHVCASVAGCALSVRRVRFDTMPEKSDVSDWLKEHTEIADLRKLIREAPLWEGEAKKKHNFYVSAEEFLSHATDKVDWLVQDVIQRGGNGMIGAEPKTGKSFVSVDLALGLATGTHFLGFVIPIPTRVGIVSREDDYRLTAWRMSHLMLGRGFNATEMAMISQNIYCNARGLTDGLMIDDPAQVDELIQESNNRHLEFLIFDVFNKLHCSDENDNTQMAEIMRKLNDIQQRTGAQLTMLHHYNKISASGRISQRLRGASSIGGWAEWMVGMTFEDEVARVVKVEFDGKCSSAKPVYFHIESFDKKGPVSIDLIRGEDVEGEGRK
jgi:hypothetical protein